MQSRSLVPHSPGLSLPIANVRNVFRPHDVERKLAKLPARDHENLRATYDMQLTPCDGTKANPAQHLWGYFDVRVRRDLDDVCPP